MKKYLIVLLLLVTGLSFAQNQVTVTVGSQTVHPSDTLISIPINVANFSGVGAISLKFRYSDTVLTWRDAANWNSGSSATNMAFSNNGVASISIFSLSPINISGGKLVDLMFKYNGGSTDLNFILGECEISDSLGNTIKSTFTSGYVGAQHTITLSSSPVAGGTTKGGGVFWYRTADTVIAVPNAGYSFINWAEGQNVVSTDASYIFTVTGNRNLTANFKENSAGYKVTGVLTYDNSSATPVTDTKVYLKNDTGVIDSAVTDNSGNYTFNAVANGNYSLDAVCAKEWAGVNSTDALNIRKYQVGLITIEGLRLKAGDNNGNGSVNSTDALNIRKRLASLITSFSIPDWVFDTPSFTVNGADVIQNMKGLCTGDVNGSNVPTK